MYAKIVSFEVIKQLISKKARIAPTIVKIKGTFFKRAEANSASIVIKFSYDIIIPFKKKGEPRPIIISLDKNPQKILPIDKIISGKAIFIGAS